MSTRPLVNTPAATQNVRVEGLTPLLSPRELQRELPGAPAYDVVRQSRAAIEAILTGGDDRLLVVVGPCSIHDPDAAREYAQRLAELRSRVEDRLLLVMRVYFEKPRTTVGWKGLINDPHLDGSFDMEHGLRLARKLLIDVNQLGLPAATEMLDPITPQYLDDLIAWGAIGARTTESQTHRQMASGLSMPVGFKNSTDGNLQIAIDAMKSAASAHRFLGIDEDGATCIVHTTGNPHTHLILRGGADGPNFACESVRDAAGRLRKAKLNPRLMIDCSHANSGKDFARQPAVLENVVEQRGGKQCPIIGVMIESNLEAGRQDMPKNSKKLQYGVSITDACIDWATTETMLRNAAKTLRGE